MPENIFEHSTSIVGLTCKPLDILPETISPQEMSRARGGNDGAGGPAGPGAPQPGQNPDEAKTEGKVWQQAAQEVIKDQKPKLPGLEEGGYVPDPSSYNINGPGGEGINPIGDAFQWAVERVTENVTDVWEDVKDEWDWFWEEEEDEGEEDEGEEDEGSGLDGMEGDFDLSENEMFT